MTAEFGLLLPLIPIEILLSTKGLMFLLLSAYGGAMWTFLSGAPRVLTITVPDLDKAKALYEGPLKLLEAELPLQYYYGYEQNAMGATFDSIYFPGDIAGARRYASPPPADMPGLWYQLSDNVQLHVIPGSTEPDNAGIRAGIPTYNAGSYGTVTRVRHTSFERDTIKALLKQVIKQRISHSVRSEKPLTFWIKDATGLIIEIAEVTT